MPAGKGWPGMRDPGYIRWEPWRVRQLAESHAHSRKAEVSVSLTDSLNLQQIYSVAGFLPPTPKWAEVSVSLTEFLNLQPIYSVAGFLPPTPK